MHELTARQPKRILIVEDDHEMARMLRRLFEMPLPGAHDGTNQGKCAYGQWFVTITETASTAAAVLHSNEYDVVLLDLILPDAEREDLIHIIHEAAPDVPIIAHSGLSETDMVARLLYNGEVADYIVKGTPNSACALKKKVCHVIDCFHTQREVTAHQMPVPLSSTPIIEAVA